MEPGIIQLIRAGQIDEVRQIFDDKWTSRKIFLEQVGSNLNQFIGLTARHGSIEILQRCIKHGVLVKIGRSCGLHALVGAASQGQDHVITWLLKPWIENGRFVNGQKHYDKHDLPEGWLFPALHKAVQGQYASTVKLLVQEGWAAVDACEKDNVKPLHVAAANVDKDNPEQMSRYEEIVDILVTAGARVNEINPLTQTTPLYDAVCLNSRAATLKLIDAGADVFAWINESQNTVLHTAAEAGFHEILRVILEHERFRELGSRAFDIGDERNRTPLYLAANRGHLECVRILAKKGFNLASETTEKETVLDALFKHVPHPVEFLKEILDDQISTTDDTGEKVILDFRLLTSNESHKHGYCAGDMEVVSALIKAVPNMEQMAILQHPLVETFLNLQYLPVMPYDCLLLFIHLLYVGILSWQVTNLAPIENYRHDYKEQILLVLPVIILIDNGIRIIFGAIAGTVDKLQLFLLSASAFISTMNVSFGAIIADDYTRTNPDSYYSSRLAEFGSVVVLWSWINVMVVLNRFPFTGEYYFMFFIVLKNVVKILFSFACPIIGLGVSFSLLFSNIDQFTTPWKALAKNLAMMTGEYDIYSSLFTPTDQNSSVAIENGTSSLQTPGAIMFLIVLIVTGITLINLMVSLAIRDIQELLKEGRSRRLMKQAESVTVSFFRPVKIISRIKELDLKSSCCFPCLGISPDVKRSLSELASKNVNRTERTQTDLSCENGEDEQAVTGKELKRLNTRTQLMMQDRNIGEK